MFSPSRGSADYYLVFYRVFQLDVEHWLCLQIVKMTAIFQLSFTCCFECLDRGEIQR